MTDETKQRALTAEAADLPSTPEPTSSVTAYEQADPSAMPEAGTSPMRSIRMLSGMRNDTVSHC